MASFDIAQAEALPPIVLLVDDDAEALAAYSACFEASGLWAATASHPHEALEAVDELKPDLVITDSFQHSHTALDLVHTLKARLRGRQIPLLLLSRGALAQVPLATRQAADLCLEKPVLPEVLVSSSRRLISLAREQRQKAEVPRPPVPQLAATAPPAEAGHSSTKRRCPDCGAGLNWIETGRLFGADYDYYRWCMNGCGLYCYDRDRGAWVKLA